MKIRDLPNQSSQFTLLFGYLLLFGFVIYSTTLGRSFTALTPHNYDAQFFAYIGSQWAQGKIPYVDIWDNKPPGIFALTAIVSSYFPDIFQALSVIEGIFIIGCITTIYLLMKQLGAPRSATVLSTVAAAAACNLFYYNERGLLTEVYLLWPATMSMFLFVIGIHRSQQIWLVLSGICTGVALLFITIGLSLYLVQLVFLAWTCAVRRYPCRYSLFSALSPSIGIILL